MSRSASLRYPIFASLTLAGVVSWSSCAGPTEQTTDTNTATSTGSGGDGGSGGSDPQFDGGAGGDDSGACVSTKAAAHHVSLDIVFLIDVSGSMMENGKWAGTTSALTTFFNDPASASIGAGIVYFPTETPYDCDVTHYQVLDVPIATLPLNAFPLTNSMPAAATGIGTPTYGALKGALMAATAYQDAHTTHKVVLVLATDGDPVGCGGKPIDEIAALAKSALSYNGVTTYVIGAAGSFIGNLDKIAAAGGTKKAFDISADIGAFLAKIAEIRNEALGCDFEIPDPPNGEELTPGDVNFSYTPKGVGEPKLIPRADDLADCADKPGWYYDNNDDPKKIILCPASCLTVQSDATAKIEVLYGCKSVIN